MGEGREDNIKRNAVKHRDRLATGGFSVVRLICDNRAEYKSSSRGVSLQEQ